MSKRAIGRLRESIRNHDYLYYVLDKPQIADGEYDSLYRKLKDLEDVHSELVTNDSPTQRVGGEPIKSFLISNERQPAGWNEVAGGL